VSWNHASCFTLPKKLLPEEFFANLEVSEDVIGAQLSKLRDVLDGSEGGTPGAKRASGASDSGSSKKKAKTDITKGMSDAEYVLCSHNIFIFLLH